MRTSCIQPIRSTSGLRPPIGMPRARNPQQRKKSNGGDCAARKAEDSPRRTAQAEFISGLRLRPPCWVVPTDDNAALRPVFHRCLHHRPFIRRKLINSDHSHLYGSVQTNSVLQALELRVSVDRRATFFVLFPRSYGGRMWSFGRGGNMSED